MNVKLIEMTTDERSRLKDLFDLPDFELLRTAIAAKEAELQVAAGEAVTELMAYGANQPESLPVEVHAKVVQLLRWRSARQVLEEISKAKFWPVREVRLTTEG